MRTIALAVLAVLCVAPVRASVAADTLGRDGGLPVRVARVRHAIDSMLNRRDTRDSARVDTTYLRRAPERLRLKVRINCSGSDIDTRGVYGGAPYEARLEAKLRTTLSFGASYRGLSVGVALNPAKFAPHAKVIQIDIAPSELGKNVAVDLSLAGDASYILQAILPFVEKTEHKLWMEQIRAWQKNDYKPVDSDTELRPHQLIEEICRQAGPDAVYVTDVGQHQMWAAQYLHHTHSRGFLTSGGLGTMGFGYGAAIGAQMALGRNARVIMLTGDGSFHMNLNEGCTAVSYGLPIITVIFNNQVLGMVRQWQTAFYGKRYADTDPHRRTDFVKLAEGFGAKGYRAATPEEFKAAFADALKQDGPSWIDCRIGKDEKVLPMIPGGGTVQDILME